jgi:hypothetical protein
MIRQALITRENGKKYDDLLIEFSNGERLSVFFDVTHLNYSRDAQERIKARFPEWFADK